MTLGLLASYRYMLTPRSALELNYGYQQNTQYYQVFGKKKGGIHTLQQEFSGAYVFNLNFKNFNPFLEAGPGAMIFRPLKDAGTSDLDAKQNTNIGALFGGGVAYELSPSFDIRAEYRGFLVKTPNFSLPSNSSIPTGMRSSRRRRLASRITSSQERFRIKSKSPGDDRGFSLLAMSICGEREAVGGADGENVWREGLEF